MDLPEDEPDVLECFLQFLYTGTYTEQPATVPNLRDDVCMLRPEEIEQELQTTPGANVADAIRDPTPIKSEDAQRGRDTEPGSAGQTADSGSEYDSGSGSEPDEPVEEYYDFGEECGRDTDSALDNKLLQLIDELGEEEGRKKFYHELHTE